MNSLRARFSAKRNQGILMKIAQQADAGQALGLVLDRIILV